MTDDRIDRDTFADACTAIGLLAGVVAGGVAALWLGIFGLLVMVGGAMFRVAYEVRKLRRGTE